MEKAFSITLISVPMKANFKMVIIMAMVRRSSRGQMDQLKAHKKDTGVRENKVAGVS